MIEIINPYSGANFTHSGKNCNATGDFRVENAAIKHIGIAGHYTKGQDVYAFTADRDDQGNVNIAGVPAGVLKDVAEAVAGIVADVEAQAIPAEPANAE